MTIKTPIAALCAAAWMLPAAAFAQTCPAAPMPPAESTRPARVGDAPPQPACVDARGSTARCRKGEIDRANAEVEAYNEAIERFNKDSHVYVQSLNDYVTAAQDYAQCELDIVNGKTHAPRP